MDNLNSFFTIQRFPMSHNVSPYSGHISLQRCSTEWNSVPLMLAESIANRIGCVKLALEGGCCACFCEVDRTRWRVGASSVSGGDDMTTSCPYGLKGYI